MKKNFLKKRLVSFLVGSLAIMCLAGCSGKFTDKLAGNESVLNSDNPVSITIWHYYNGAQQASFEDLVNEFNSSEGKEKGIYVQAYTKGSVPDLEEAVISSIEEKVGAEAMPDIFSSYPDTAYAVEESGRLCNLSEYFTDEELDKYVDSYIEEGKIAADNTLRIFPVAKSTEITMVNKTDWDAFAAATGADIEDLKTFEGITKTAKKYYEWSGGKAFYGRDAMANYFIDGVRQFGKEIFEVKDGKVTVNIEKEVVKKLWDNYYVPMMRGYFGAYGKYRSDDVKTGEIIAYTGSTSSADYFPDKVESDEGAREIEYMILPPPVFEGGENIMIQQGAGMVVSKSDKAHEYASCEFLKWFTQLENNYKFGSSSGYLPVLKEANNSEVFEKFVKEEQLDIKQKTYDTFENVFEYMKNATLYSTKAFKDGAAGRKVLEYAFTDKISADLEAIDNKVNDGENREKIIGDYVSDAAFEEWYNSFAETLNTACGK